MCDMDDLHVCFIGDSFVAGVGDPRHLGWARRLAARSARAGRPLTAYDLGVRRQTSRDISRRWLLECQQRLPDAADSRVVLSFGVNDATADGAGPRVPPDESAGHLAGMLDQLQTCVAEHFAVSIDHSTFQFELVSHAAHEGVRHA